MRRSTIILATAVTAVAVTASGGAQTGEVPFPSPTIPGVFVSSQTVTPPGSALGAGVLTNYYAQGSSAVYRVFAAESKTGHVLMDTDVTYAYVSIPGQPNLKLAYKGSYKANDPVARWPWTATWSVPADYPLGLVNFKVLLKTKDKQYGSFVQLPVSTSQLTITKG